MNTKKLKSSINADSKVVSDFGREWEKFNHSDADDEELRSIFDDYFSLFPFEKLNKDSVGFDMGCGTGRWAKIIAPKVKYLSCIDASNLALNQAKFNLARFSNCGFECASIEDSSLTTNSQDFGYCLGVLHHVPDTQRGLKSCAEKLKPGSPFLLYLYYRFDNKPSWFAYLWRLSDFARRFISKLPFPVKHLLCQFIALALYYPLSRIALIMEKLNIDISNIPLSDYRRKSLYIMRTDALDRFGTRLEKRFTRNEIQKMMADAGFKDIAFRENTPFWVAIGTKI